jgi:hypothetical protein
VDNGVKLLQQCFFCTHASKCMTSFTYINDTGDFNESGILNNNTLKLLWSTIIFNTIQRRKAYPKEWKMATVCSFYENRGKVGEPNTYTVVSLLLVVRKIVSSILASRLTDWLMNNKTLLRF